MAKPFAKDSGNGLHVHFSVLDQSGRNLFAGDRCRKAFVASKRQEKQKLEAIITTLEYETYLRNV